MNNKIIYLLLPTTLLFDILTNTVFEKNSSLSYIKASLYFSIIIYALIYGLFKKKYGGRIIIFFSLYVVLQIPFSSDPGESIRMSLKILMSILMFPVGLYFINNIKKLKVLNKSLIFMMIIYILNYAISQSYGIGTSVYTGEKEFLVGNLSDSWNIITYMILVTPAVILTENKKTVFVLSTILIILLILSLKRSAILGLVVGFFIYVLRTRKVVKFSRTIVILSILLISLAPFYESILLTRIEARGEKLSQPAQKIIENETRYLESLEVWNEVYLFQNPIKVLFGLQAFNSIGNYANGRFDDRQIHIDYNLIVNTIGVIGLLIYLKIFHFIHKRFVRIKRIVKKDFILTELDGVFYMLLISQFITSFGGQMYVFTFRAIIFLYLGSIIGIFSDPLMRNKKIKN